MEQREDKTTTTAADGGGGDVWGDDERTRGLEGAAVKRGEGNHTQEKAKQRKEDDGPRAVKVAMDVPLPGRGQCDVNIFLDRVDADNNSGDASDDEREDDNDHHDNEAGSAGQQKEQQGKPVHASADDHHRESLQQTDRPYIRVWSTFDSGNLQAVQAVEVPTRDNDMTLHLEAEVSPDILARASQRELKTWFYFKVTRLDPSRVHTLRVTLTNMTKQLRLYNQGLTPIVYRQHKGQQSGRWGRYCSSVDAELDDDGDFLLSFTYVVDDTHTRDSIVGFAFCYPFSYTECEHMLASYDKRFNHEASAADAGVYFHREVVCKSRDGRSVHLVTITANDDGLSVDQREPRIPPLFPDRNTKRPRVAPDRPVFFVSARVHPGETPASHVCNGIIDFVLNTEDARACALRSMFVFKIIPMLNPDGVARGHYRGDSHGLNLNRFYNNPCPTTHPSIFASKVLTSFYSQQQAGLAFYIDTHGHATKRGCFLYGNCLESARHIDNVTYAKLAELNSPHFDFGCCNFSEKNMFSKDKRDGLSKEGSGRVGTFIATDITHCYTLECNYNSGRRLNIMPPCLVEGARVERYPPSADLPPYTAAAWADVGRSLVVSALDLHGANPWSRVPASEFASIAALRTWVKGHIKSSKKMASATQAGRGKINVKRRVYREGNDAIRAIIDKALAKTRAVQHHQQQSPCASKRVLRPRSRPTTARRPMSSRQPRPRRQHDASSARDGVGRTPHATHGHAVRQQQQQQLQQLQQQHHHQAPVASADVRLRAVAKPPTLSPRSCRRGRTRDGGDGEQGDDGGGDGGDENGDTGGGGGDDSGGGSDDEDYADDDEDTEAQDTIQRQQQQQRRRQWRSSQRQAALVRPPPSLQYGQQDQLLSLRPTRSTMDRRQRLPDNRLPTTSQQLHARAILTSAYAPRLRPRRTSQPADSLRISGYGGKPASQTHTSTSSL